MAERLFGRGDANTEGRLSAVGWQMPFQQAAKSKDGFAMARLSSRAVLAPLA
jgi:hypothetical protein